MKLKCKTTAWLAFAFLAVMTVACLSPMCALAQTETLPPSATPTQNVSTEVSTQDAHEALSVQETACVSVDLTEEFPSFVDGSSQSIVPLSVDGRASETVLRVRDALAWGARNYLNEVDVESLGATYKDCYDAFLLIHCDPEFFYVDGRFQAYVYMDSDIEDQRTAASVILEFYWQDASTIQYAKRQMADAVYDVMCWTNNYMSDGQKVQAIHDYFVRNCAYDLNAPDADVRDVAYSSYGALVQKSAVCQGYAYAFKTVATRLGIPCVYVASDAMEHGWVMVYVDGSWYHVDPTWDDPVPDGGFEGWVSYENFMKSDREMQDAGYYGWEAAHAAWKGGYATPLRSYMGYAHNTESDLAKKRGRVVDLMFPDLNAGEWYNDAVGYGVTFGYMKGYGNGYYGINNQLTRAQAAMVLWRILDPQAASSYREDVTPNRSGLIDVEGYQWYTGAANWAVSHGVINGVLKDGTRYFDPYGTVTRQQLCTILCNVAREYYGEDTSYIDDTNFNAMPDAMWVDEWAKDGMAWSLNEGIIHGVKAQGMLTLDPFGKVDRATMAQMMMNALDNRKLIRG